MRIANINTPTRTSPPTRAAAKPETPEEPVENFGEGIPGYTGPADGLSHPKFRWLTGPLNKALVAGCFRMEVEGQENFPHEGPQVYCPTHPSMFDPPLVAALSSRDLRYLANIYVFDGARGKLMTWGGAFPLHRDNPKFKTVRHSVDVIRQGKGFVIFPEGGIASEQEAGQVGPLKKGAAKLAILGGAQAITPIATDYQPNTKSRPLETAVGALASAGIAVGGALSAFGGPVTRIVGGTISGALTGMFVAGKINRNITYNPEWYDPFPKYFATVNGGLLGAAIGGLTGGLASALLPPGGAQLAGVAMGLGAGAGAWNIAQGWRDRDVARVRIGKPIPVAPYVEKYGTTREAADALTIDLHKALAVEKNALNGVAQAEPSFRGKVEETLAVDENGNPPPPPASGPDKLKATLNYAAVPLATGTAGTLLGLGASALFGLPPALTATAGLVGGVAVGAQSAINYACEKGMNWLKEQQSSH